MPVIVTGRVLEDSVTSCVGLVVLKHLMISSLWLYYYYFFFLPSPPNHVSIPGSPAIGYMDNYWIFLFYFELVFKRM